MAGRSLLVPLTAFVVAAAAPAAWAKCTIYKLDLPVSMSGMRPLVSVKINGTETKLIADSGAFFSLIDEDAARGLKLPIQGLGGVRIGGVGGSEFASLTHVKKLELGNIPFSDVPFFVARAPLGGGAEGLLGQNVLGIGDVEYDLANGVIHVYFPKGCGDVGEQLAANYPGVIKIDPPSERDPHTFGTIKVNGKEVRAMFDTGASTSVITRRAAEHLGIRITDASVQAGGVSGGIGSRTLESWIAPFDLIEFGNEQIKNTAIRVSTADLEQSDMLIGADFFLSHKVYVDNREHRLYFSYNGGPVFALHGARKPTQAAAAPPELDGPSAPASGDAEDLSRRASAAGARGDFPGAIALLDKAIALKPDQPDLYVLRARARLANRQPLMGLADLEHALKLKPDDGEALLVRGELYLGRRDAARAKADFDAAVKASPREDLRLAIAAAYERAGHYPQAAEQIDGWIADHQRAETLVEGLTASCRTRGQWGQQLERALSDCDAALRRTRNSELLDARGMVHLRLGHLDQAIGDYDAALKLQPKRAWALYGRGLAKQRKGDKAGGDADLAAAVALNPTLPALARRYGLIEGGAVKSAAADGKS